MNKATITTNSIRSTLTAVANVCKGCSCPWRSIEKRTQKPLSSRLCSGKRLLTPFQSDVHLHHRLPRSAGRFSRGIPTLTSCERGQPIVEDQRPHQEHDGRDNHPARPVGRETQSLQ